MRYEPGTVEMNGEKLYVGSKEWDEISEKTNEIIQRHGLTPIDTENTRKRRSVMENGLMKLENTYGKMICEGALSKLWTIQVLRPVMNLLSV